MGPFSCWHQCVSNCNQLPATSFCMFMKVTRGVRPEMASCQKGGRCPICLSCPTLNLGPKPKHPLQWHHRTTLRLSEKLWASVCGLISRMNFLHSKSLMLLRPPEANLWYWATQIKLTGWALGGCLTFAVALLLKPVGGAKPDGPVGPSFTCGPCLDKSVVWG